MTENQEQVALFQWAELMEGKYGEKWEFIPRTNKLYVVSIGGEVMRVPYTCMRIDGRKYKFPAKMIAKTKDRKGYLNVSLLLESGKRKSFKVHRLVANAFIKNPKNKPQVNHKDSDKTNNHVSNLEWVNQQENMEHSVMAGTKWTKPVRCVNDGLIFRSMRSAVRYYGVGHKEISKCCNGVLAATKGKKFEFVSKEDAVDGIYRTTRANNAF